MLGRILDTYLGRAWLSGLNDRFYFPAVFVINLLLALWFYSLATRPSSTQAQA